MKAEFAGLHWTRNDDSVALSSLLMVVCPQRIEF